MTSQTLPHVPSAPDGALTPTVVDPGRVGAGPGRTPALRRGVGALTARLDAGVRWVVDTHGTRLPRLATAYDGAVIRRRMQRSLGYRPDLRHPRTYNEKLAWRILHDDNPLIPLTTDKIAVRDHVAARLGPDVLIPLIGAYERTEEIDWDALPSSFVLKAAHGCAMNLLVPDKSAVDRDEVLRTAAEWLRTDYYRQSRERAYRRIPPRLLIEEFLVDESGEPPADYKFLVFHGRTALIRVHRGRFGEHRVTFYDPDLRRVPIRQVVDDEPDVPLPAAVRAMIPQAETLAADFDYARIDLYLHRGRTYFGEITHHDGNAHVPFRPASTDAALGAMWRLGEHPVASGV